MKHPGRARRLRLALSAGIIACGLAWSAPGTPPPLAAYSNMPYVEFPVLSRSGQRLAMVVGTADQRLLVVQQLYGKVLITSKLGDAKVRSVFWAGEDIVVVWISSTQNLGMDYGFKHELSTMVTIDLKTLQAHWPLNNSRVLNAAFGYYGTRQENGRWYGYVGMLPMSHSTYTGDSWLSSGERQLMRIDLVSGKMTTAGYEGSRGRGWLLDADGVVVARHKYDAQAKSWCLSRGKFDDDCLVKLNDVFGDDGIEGLGRSAGTVLYDAVDADGAVHYMEVPLADSHAPTEILNDQDIAQFVFDPTTRLAIGARLEGPGGALILFDPERQLAVNTVLHSFSQEVVAVHSWSDDYRRFLVYTAGHDDSGSWWFVDLDTHRAFPFGRTYPDVPATQIGANRVLSYQAGDGLALEGMLTLPPGVEPRHLPLVVLPHGGPEARDYRGFNWLAQAFASRGYAVWQPNFRGSAGYGIAFRNAGMGEWGRKMQSDISDGVVELAHQGIVDPARACIVGASYGGYAALAGVTVQQGLYRCAVSYAGVADLNAMLQQDAIYYHANVTRYWKAYMGVKDSARRDLAGISPAGLAERADAPVLLIHGKDDTVVPIEQSRIMKRALERAGKPVEFVELGGEDHYLSNPQTRAAMLEAAVAFVQRHNPAAVP